MSQQPKIAVGQTLYYQTTPRVGMPVLNQAKVKKIGKKYLYLEAGYLSRFPVDLQTLRVTVSSIFSVQLYRSPEEIEDIHERQSIMGLMQKHFAWNGNGAKNTLEQLRQAAAALGIEIAPRPSFTTAPADL